MHSPSQLAKHLREVYTGGNWTSVNLKDTLEGISWQQATTKVHSFNTIVALVYHINYYITAVMKVLEGGQLDAKDKFSFDHPPVDSQEDWEALLNKTRTETEKFAGLIEQFPEDQLDKIFVDEKYGTYYRNFLGIVEHTHYHLGQIVLIKKLIIENPIAGTYCPENQNSKI
jgi:uncharacterized damage-inducible protein DinB